MRFFNRQEQRYGWYQRSAMLRGALFYFVSLYLLGVPCVSCRASVLALGPVNVGGLLDFDQPHSLFKCVLPAYQT